MSVYKRGGRYWYTFVFDGRRIQRSAKTKNAKLAADIEKAAWNNLARGAVGLPTDGPQKNITVGELLDTLKATFEDEKKLSQQQLSVLKLARREFGSKLASELTSKDVEAYITEKRQDGKKNATINRVTETLRRAFRVAKLPAPEIRHLSEAGNARKGFFSVQELELVVANLPENLRDFTRFAFATAWRKGEVASLRWSDVEDDLIRLRAERSKNGEARQIVIDGDLTEIIKRRRALRAIETSEGTLLCENIFHRKGEVVVEFRKSWARACVAAKVGTMACSKCKGEGDDLTCPHCNRPTKYRGKIFHDLRRSGVRDMIRGGVPQSVAMKISGHKTASMFRRYDIASESDLRQAMLSVQKYREAELQKVVSLGR
jgi:integrase